MEKQVKGTDLSLLRGLIFEMLKAIKDGNFFNGTGSSISWKPAYKRAIILVHYTFSQKYDNPHIIGFLEFHAMFGQDEFEEEKCLKYLSDWLGECSETVDLLYKISQ